MLEFDDFTRASDSLMGPESNLYFTGDDQRVYAQYPTNERAGHNAYIASGVLNKLGFTSTKVQLVDNGMVALDAPRRLPGFYINRGNRVSRLHAKSITAAAWIGMEEVFYNADPPDFKEDDSPPRDDDDYEPADSRVYLELLFKTFDTGFQGVHRQYEASSVPLYRKFLSSGYRTPTSMVYKGMDDAIIQEAVDMIDTFATVPRESIIDKSGLDGAAERSNNMRDNLLDMSKNLP